MDKVQYDRIAERYQRTRGMQLDAIAAWREVLAPFLGVVAPLPLLDLGAGTGQFTRAFGEWFAVPILALEPSAGMRREARRSNPHRLARWVGGRAEALPLRDASCGAAWASTVLHHIPDLAACVRELRRVLVADAPVLIRSAFPECDEGITLLRYFPQARRRLAQYPSVQQVTAALAQAGFGHFEIREVEQTSALDMQDYRRRVFAGRRADSLLASLDDDEFTHGMMALDDAARAAGQDSAPVVDRLTLLVAR